MTSDIAAFRSEFPIVDARSYLYSGALAPACRPVREALLRWAENWTIDPIECYDAVEVEAAALRTSFAKLIGCTAAEVAIADNTSRAANLVVAALRERAGTKVVIDQTTYPSSAYPWLTMTGHHLNRVEAGNSSDPLDRLASAVDDQTVAVSVTHVAPETGFRHQLRELAAVAHSHGSVLIVDAAQSTGVLPIDVSALGVDALVTTTMKWLLGPPGVGLLYLADDLLKDAPALEVGYMGVNLPMSEDWPMTELPPLTGDGRQLELGIPGLACLAPARGGWSCL